MLEHEFEERLESLEKKVEDLTIEIKEVKKEREEEVTLIPGSEYDFVPSIEEKVIARGRGRIVQVVQASHELGLSAREWELLAADASNEGDDE